MSCHERRSDERAGTALVGTHAAASVRLEVVAPVVEHEALADEHALVLGRPRGGVDPDREDAGLLMARLTHRVQQTHAGVLFFGGLEEGESGPLRTDTDDLRECVRAQQIRGHSREQAAHVHVECVLHRRLHGGLVLLAFDQDPDLWTIVVPDLALVLASPQERDLSTEREDLLLTDHAAHGRGGHAPAGELHHDVACELLELVGQDRAVALGLLAQANAQAVPADLVDLSTGRIPVVEDHLDGVGAHLLGHHHNHLVSIALPHLGGAADDVVDVALTRLPQPGIRFHLYTPFNAQGTLGGTNLSQKPPKVNLKPIQISRSKLALLDTDC